MAASFNEYDLGNYSFLAGPPVPGASTAPPEGAPASALHAGLGTALKPTIREVNYETGPTALYKAIENREWTSAVARARHSPSEAGTWVYRLGGDGETVRWKVLPLHQVHVAIHSCRGQFAQYCPYA